MSKGLVIDREEFFLERIARTIEHKTFLEKSRTLNSLAPEVKNKVLLIMGSTIREKGRAGELV